MLFGRIMNSEKFGLRLLGWWAPWNEGSLVIDPQRVTWTAFDAFDTARSEITLTGHITQQRHVYFSGAVGVKKSTCDKRRVLGWRETKADRKLRWAPARIYTPVYLRFHPGTRGVFTSRKMKLCWLYVRNGTPGNITSSMIFKRGALLLSSNALCSCYIVPSLYIFFHYYVSIFPI